jgi:hypothetical protein
MNPETMVDSNLLFWVILASARWRLRSVFGVRRFVLMVANC